MGLSAPVNAEGELGIIPLAHLLVYVLDRQLTGELFLRQADGVEHVVRFVRGAAVKVRPGDGATRLGELLTEAGEIAPEALQAALAAGGMLGEALVEAGCLSPLALDHALEMQFRKRMTRLFALPPETSFRCVEGSEQLADWGAEASVDPLELLWAGIRQHADASSMVEGTLARLGDAIPRLHERAAPERFGFAGEEREALDMIHANPIPFAELLSFEALPEATLRRVLYVLLITRHVDSGRGLPAGVDDRRAAPPVGVARVQLRAAVHRLGAAAPDPPGDGERAVVSPSSRAKRRSMGVPPATVSGPGGGPAAGREPAEVSGAEPPSSRPGQPGEPPLTSSGVRQAEASSSGEVELGSGPRGRRGAAEEARVPVAGSRLSPPAMARAVGFTIVDEDTGSSLVERAPPRAAAASAQRPPSGLYSLQSLDVAAAEVEIDVDLDTPVGGSGEG